MACALDTCNNLPPLVLVTGASGFIATHIVQQLLAKGQVRVRGTVRTLKNEDKVKPLYNLVPDAKHPLELMEAELNDSHSWTTAVKGCSCVYHVASPLPSSIPTNENDLIVPAVEGTLNVLRACSEVNTIKRVVLTSSLAAISGGLHGKVGQLYTEDDWADETPLPPYEKSKILAEKAAWDFVEKLEKDKKFELVTVHPSVVIGPPLTEATGYSTSLQTVRKLLSGEIPVLLHMCLPLIDVRDVAATQIAAMEAPQAAGKRYIINAENRWLREISEIMSKELSHLGYKLPSWTLPKPGVWLLSFFDKTISMVYPTLGYVIKLNNERMISELGVIPRPVEETIIDSCYALIDIGVVSASIQYQKHKILSSSIKEEEGTAEDKTTNEEKSQEPTTEEKSQEPTTEEMSQEPTTEEKSQEPTTEEKSMESSNDGDIPAKVKTQEPQAPPESETNVVKEMPQN